MDNQLKELISLAGARGSKYMKGETAVSGIPEKVSELGVFLLTRSTRISELSGDKLREELNDIQQKIDDLRKAIFSNKLKK
ncbi:MAG: hypothetical protein EPN94_09880 [Nitrospirae bacterium]|nr:MAG: hypothetical protein EPN94_09880 [Nitrospirota bacterium]